MATKKEAIAALEAAGYRAEARELDKWRNRDGNNGGWDGFLRHQWPRIAEKLLPELGPSRESGRER